MVGHWLATHLPSLDPSGPSSNAQLHPRAPKKFLARRARTRAHVVLFSRALPFWNQSGSGSGPAGKNIKKCINLWFKAKCFTSWQILVRRSLRPGPLKRKSRKGAWRVKSMRRSPLKAPGWWALGDQCSSSWVIVPKHSSHVPCSSQTAAAMSILGHSWDKTLLWDTVEEHSLETHVCATLLHEGLFLQHSGSTQLQNRGQSVVNVTDPGGFDKANRIQSNESPVGACKAHSVCPVVERSHGQSIIQLEKDIYAWHILTLRLVLDTLPSKMSSWAWCFMTCRPHMCVYIYINRHTIPYHCITLHCIAYMHLYIYTYLYIQIIYIIRLGTPFVAP